MSFTIGEAVVYFRGDNSKLDRDIDTTEGKVGGFASKAAGMLGGVLTGGAVAAGAAILSIGAGALSVTQQTEEAAGQIAAQLGIPIEKAREFGEVAQAVYGANFAGSVTEAGAAVALLAQQLGLSAGDPALQTLTENAFRLKDAFGVDVSQSVSTVQTLMENFGLSSTAAFDMLAAGYQRGLDRSGDFLDTVNEYSTQFANGGATASEFFSLMETGLQGGVLGTDKAADAFKEFRLRIGDGSQTTADGLALLGENIDQQLVQKLAAGQITAAEAFNEVVAGLSALEDPTARMQAGAALLGTQFEDLGDSAVSALSMTNDWADGSEGAIGTLDAQYNTFGDAVSSVWRRLTVSLSPFTDKLMELVNQVMPHVMAAFDTFDKNVGPIMDEAKRVIDNVVGFVRNLFSGFKSDTDTNLTGPLQYWKAWVDENMPRIQQIIDTALTVIRGFWDLFGESITRIVGNAFEGIKVVIDTVMRTIGDIITIALQLMTGDWGGAMDTLEGAGRRIFEALGTIFSLGIDNLRAVFDIDWGSVGSAVIDGIRNGISNRWESLSGWFREKLQGLRNMLPFSEPKDPGSPLRGLGKAGAATVDMYREGMDRALGGLSASLSGGLAGLVAQPAAAGGATNIAITVNGAGDPAATGRAVESGVLSALRRAGRR